MKPKDYFILGLLVLLFLVVILWAFVVPNILNKRKTAVTEEGRVEMPIAKYVAFNCGPKILKISSDINEEFGIGTFPGAGNVSKWGGQSLTNPDQFITLNCQTWHPEYYSLLTEEEVKKNISYTGSTPSSYFRVKLVDGDETYFDVSDSNNGVAYLMKYYKFNNRITSDHVLFYVSIENRNGEVMDKEKMQKLLDTLVSETIPTASATTTVPILP